MLNEACVQIENVKKNKQQRTKMNRNPIHMYQTLHLDFHLRNRAEIMHTDQRTLANAAAAATAMEIPFAFCARGKQLTNDCLFVCLFVVFFLHSIIIRS